MENKNACLQFCSLLGSFCWPGLGIWIAGLSTLLPPWYLMFCGRAKGRNIIGRRSFDVIVNASARPPRLAGLPTVGTCNYRYTGI